MDFRTAGAGATGKSFDELIEDVSRTVSPKKGLPADKQYQALALSKLKAKIDLMTSNNQSKVNIKGAKLEPEKALNEAQTAYRQYLEIFATHINDSEVTTYSPLLPDLKAKKDEVELEFLTSMRRERSGGASPRRLGAEDDFKKQSSPVSPKTPTPIKKNEEILKNYEFNIKAIYIQYFSYVEEPKNSPQIGSKYANNIQKLMENFILGILAKDENVISKGLREQIDMSSSKKGAKVSLETAAKMFLDAFEQYVEKKAAASDDVDDIVRIIPLALGKETRILENIIKQIKADWQTTPLKK